MIRSQILNTLHCDTPGCYSAYDSEDSSNNIRTVADYPSGWMCYNEKDLCPECVPLRDGRIVMSTLFYASEYLYHRKTKLVFDRIRNRFFPLNIPEEHVGASIVLAYKDEHGGFEIARLPSTDDLTLGISFILPFNRIVL